MAELDPVSSPRPLRPPGDQQRLPDHRRHERRRRSEVPPEAPAEDAGERSDSEPLIDDYA